MIAVAFDTGGPAAVRDFIRPPQLVPPMFQFMGWSPALAEKAAAPTYPCLIDERHALGELFGIINVPTAVWIDEDGMIVRPAEPAHPGRNPVTDSFKTMDLDTLPPELADVLREAQKIRTEPELYVEMLRDWAANGADSQYALSADEVVARSRPRDLDGAAAAAHFELGQHLHHNGDHDAAIPHWREAHRLDPDN